MSENYIKPEDVSSEGAQKILNFLNSAQSAEEIDKAVEIRDERDVGIIVAQHILDGRKELGKFTNLQQVADVRQVGPERFTEIVNTLGGIVMSFPDAVEIKNYIYGFYGSLPKDKEIYADFIMLYDKNGHLIGTVLFQDDSSELRELVIREYHVTMFCRRSMLSLIIDMLRNEKPVHLHVGLANAFISTSKEPVGEEELAL